MCTRYNLTSSSDSVRDHFQCAPLEAFPPRYNIAPMQPVGIVRSADKGGREFVLVQWGLLPGWVKDPTSFGRLFNARAEGVLDMPSFRAGIRHRRCLVPANGYYEWIGSRANKRPHLVCYPDRSLLAFAGILDHWMGADGSEIETMAIVTQPANAAGSASGNRMPIILEQANFAAWLDVRNIRAEEAVGLARGGPAALLERTELLATINDPRAEGAELLTPAPRRTLL